MTSINYQLSKTEFLKAIENSDLYKTIVEHRFNFTKVSGIDYNVSIRQIPL